MRNRYERMPAQELKRAIRHDLGLTFGQFARLTGHQRKRVLAWVSGTEEPPHHVFVMCETWCEFPEALALARELADEMIIEEEQEEPDEAETTLP